MLAIGAEETCTQHTIADSRTRHVIIAERWDIFQEFVARNNKVKPKQTPKTPQNAQVHTVESGYSETDEFEDISRLKIHNVSNPSSNVIWVDLKVEGKPLKMELDTGSAVSIIPHDLYMEKFND